LVLLLGFAFRSQFLPGPPKEHHASPHGGLRWLAWGLPLSGCLVALAIPLAMISRDVFTGLLAVLKNRQAYEEILVALGFGRAT
jgi:hypothetical protein